MASKRRKAIKTRMIEKPRDIERQQLIRQVEKQVQETNSRLKSLSRKYRKGTWSSKKLIDRLDSKNLNAYQKGRVKLRKNLTNTQLKAIQKATSQFLQSKTSTKRGISEVRRKTIESLRSSLGVDAEKISKEDAETYYNMLSDKDFNDLSRNVGASTMWILIDDAVADSDSEEDFIRRLENYGVSNDADMREKALNLYEKYVL